MIAAARAGGLVERLDEAIIRAVRNTAEDYDQAVTEYPDVSLHTRATLMNAHLGALDRLVAQLRLTTDSDDFLAGLSTSVGDSPLP